MITGIEINNFKCFEATFVEFGLLTVLAGANSAGKSSVIQSILLSRIAYERLTTGLQKSSGVTVPLNGDYLLALGNTQEVLNRELGLEEISFSFLGETGEQYDFVLHGDSVIDSAYELSLTSSHIVTGGEKPSLFADQFCYLNAERIGPRSKYEAASSTEPNVGYQGEFTVQVLSNRDIRVDNKRFFDQDGSPLLLTQARAWMNFIIPGLNLDDATLFGKIKIAGVSFGKSAPPNVGFGVSYVLPIIVAGLTAPKGSMLIIENPEAHLHPSAQSKIGIFIARVAAAGVQIVTETHSEHLINGIRIATFDDNLSSYACLINFFSKTEDDLISITKINFTDQGDLDSWPRNFFDQQQQDFAKIIRLRNSQKENG